MRTKRTLAALAMTTLLGGGALVGLAPSAGADTIGAYGSYSLDVDWCGTPFPIRFPPPPPPDPWDFTAVFDHIGIVSPLDVGVVPGAMDLGGLGADLGGFQLGG